MVDVVDETKQLNINGFIPLDDEWLWLQKIADEVFVQKSPHAQLGKKYFGVKYEGVFDLVDENVRENLVMQLKANGIEDKVSKITRYPVQLSHCQLRYLQKSVSSYMPFHRDVSWYGNNFIGPLPIPIKLIVYPTNIADEDLLKVVPRSNKLVFKSKLVDLLVNLLMHGLERPSFGKTKGILFDTSTIHHVPRKKSDDLTGRLILTFIPQA